ncbi:unnamed protein product [Callosobruchus maculatus]|uniref:C2H2-type domain-containing protein n=1 Tax=Callosobruchus maculatus TaxID=64391 RepID=A0A653C2F2_CALMS|nr:unnamed protein product [Callosobruchus maculatus]
MNTVKEVISSQRTDENAVNEKYRENGLEVGHRNAEGDLSICYMRNYTDHSKMSESEKTAVPANGYVCSHCSRAFARKTNLDKHKIKMHSDETATYSQKLYECSICNYKTATKRNFIRHNAVNGKYWENGLEVGHRKPEGGSLICYTCNYAAHSKKSLEKHIAARNCSLKTSLPANKYVCPQCNRAFARKESLDNHETRINLEQTATHSQNVYDECSICNYKTVKKSNYDMHAHSSDRQVFSCNYCSAAYTTKHRLNDHIMRKHPNVTTDTVHDGSECTYETVKKSPFDRHNMLVHPDTASSPHTCVYCYEKFNWAIDLDDHIPFLH